jgi:hypothetical protein
VGRRRRPAALRARDRFRTEVGVRGLELPLLIAGFNGEPLMRRGRQQRSGRLQFRDMRPTDRLDFAPMRSGSACQVVNPEGNEQRCSASLLRPTRGGSALAIRGDSADVAHQGEPRDEKAARIAVRFTPTLTQVLVMLRLSLGKTKAVATLAGGVLTIEDSPACTRGACEFDCVHGSTGRSAAATLPCASGRARPVGGRLALQLLIT